MSSDWIERTLDDLILKRNQGVNTTTEKVGYTEKGIIVIRANNIIQGGIDFLNVTYVDEPTFKRIKSPCKPKTGDILYTNIGSQLGIAVKVDVNFEFIIAWNVLRIQPSKDIDADFLVYLLNNPKQKQYIKSLNSSSTMPFVNGKDLGNVSFIIPCKKIQVNISRILKSQDNKIQLNKQINQTLEQMAQTIFKSWFVDFEPAKAKMAALAAGAGQEDVLLAAMQAISGKNVLELVQLQTAQPERYAELCRTAELFPAAMQDSELGEIPEGWEVEPISEFGQIVCGKTPSKKKEEYYGGDIPFIKIPNMHDNVFITKASEYMTLEGAASQPKKSIPKGSVCVSCIATVGLVIITSEECHTNQQINSVIPTKEAYTPYLFFRMKALNKHLHDLASGGSATLNLNTSTFSKIQLIKPDNEILKAYQKITSPLLNKILENSYENNTLSETRDTLLPKLLSGELDVSQLADAQDLASEA